MPTLLPRGLYVSRTPKPYLESGRGQAELEKRIKEICETRVRYGYRRVQVLPHLSRVRPAIAG